LDKKFRVWDTNSNIDKEVKNIEEAFSVIKEYLESINFKSYYYRKNFLEDGTIWLDYGSHSHFFFIKETEEKTNG
jgi:uncharacterized protein with von Willebrand factor type A (vWA) domain